jgi:hypothetical protein
MANGFKTLIILPHIKLKQMAKTIGKWIEEAISLTPEEKAKAIAYATKYVLPNGSQTSPLDVEASSFHDAIGGAFVFYETDEGHDYWWNIALLEEKAMDKLYDYSAE